MAGEPVETLRCAPWARAAGLDPIATAGTYRGFCCVEWPLPWPRDIAMVPELAELAAETARLRVRLQGLVPRSAGAGLRVLVYRSPDGDAGFAGYELREALCAPGELVATGLALLHSPAPAAGAAAEPAARDVLLCTHGRRDVCCGSAGSALAAELEATPGGLGDGVRLWRTSHTGGHRFAPTAIVLPEATVWGFLDAAALRAVVRRDGPVDAVLGHYRGCTGLASPPLQVLERAALGAAGWPVLDQKRRGIDLGGDRYRLEVPGHGVVWEADVRVIGRRPVPDCGQPITETTKHEPDYALSGLTPVSPHSLA